MNEILNVWNNSTTKTPQAHGKCHISGERPDKSWYITQHLFSGAFSLERQWAWYIQRYRPIMSTALFFQAVVLSMRWALSCPHTRHRLALPVKFWGKLEWGLQTGKPGLADKFLGLEPEPTFTQQLLLALHMPTSSATNQQGSSWQLAAGSWLLTHLPIQKGKFLYLELETSRWGHDHSPQSFLLSSTQPTRPDGAGIGTN